MSDEKIAAFLEIHADRTLIDKIRLVRSEFGLSLEEAKAAVTLGSKDVTKLDAKQGQFADSLSRKVNPQ